MKILATLFLIGLVSGCATPLQEFPAWDIPAASTEVQHPLTVPDRPKAAEHTESTITFDEAGIIELEEFFQTAVANEVISEANANALRDQAMAFNSLLQAAEFQRQIGVIKSELLEQERSNHFWSNVWHRGFIVLIGIGVLL